MKHFSTRSAASTVQNLGYPEVIERLFHNRGIVNSEQMALGLSSLLSPLGLDGVDRASELLLEALNKNKNILIIGDYDVDGATATSVLYRGLSLCGFKNINYLIPNRFINGYGLSAAIVAQACELQIKPDMIITVDNGISSIEGVAYAKSQGIDVIITDHHLPGDSLPDADVIINPQCCPDSFASTALAGVGVAFYLCLGLRSYMHEQGCFSTMGISYPNLVSLLDLVAVGTIADLVPLDKNNRILAYQGLLRIRSGRCSDGIKALLSLAKVEISTVSAEDIAFRVAPKLNAAGRMDDMHIGVACLLSDDTKLAYSYANTLVEFNNDRRQVQHDMYDIAKQMLTSMPESNKGVCLYHDSWHQGVIGILASRVKEMCYKPVIVFAPGDNDTIKGSARSIAGVNIREILAEIARCYPNMLSKFGGHAMAAGLTIMAADFEAFNNIFVALCAGVAPELFIEHIVTDGPLIVDEISIKTAKLINEFGVWGQAFPVPLFNNTFTVVAKRLLKSQHIQLDLMFLNKSFRAIWFNSAARYPSLREGSDVCFCYQLMLSEYLGVERLSLLIREINESAAVLEKV